MEILLIQLWYSHSIDCQSQRISKWGTPKQDGCKFSRLKMIREQINNQEETWKLIANYKAWT